MNAEVSVRVQGLNKHFGAFVAVSDVSFEVKKGEIFRLPRRQWRR